MIRLLRVVSMVALLAGCTGLPSFQTILPLDPARALADEVFTLPDGARLPVRVWRPGGPPGPPVRGVVLALHGFNDSRDAWALPAPTLAAGGLLVYAPDQRGFGAAPGRGTWPGVPTLVADADAMLRLLIARHPGLPVYAMGESMGGAVLMTLAAWETPPPVAGWILLSPAVWDREGQGPLLSGSLWLVTHTAPGLSVTGAEVRLRVRASDNRDALLALTRNPLTIRRTRFDTLSGLDDLMDAAQAASARLPANTLLLYGAHDTLVPEPSMRRAWRAMPASVRRGFYPDGYHLLLRDIGRAGPIQDVLAWTKDPSGRLPSGADGAAAAWWARPR